MKKLFCFLLVLLMVAQPYIVCMAMESPPVEVDQRVMIDLTDVLIALLLLVLAIVTFFLTFVWKKWLRPWLEHAGLTDLFDEFIGAFYEFGVKNIAEIVVKAVEASIGRGNGAQKWHEALNKMQRWGFSVDDERVIDAMKAAWLNLDLKQYESGVKTKPPEPAEKAEDTAEEEQEEADLLEDTDLPVDDLVPLISEVGYK